MVAPRARSACSASRRSSPPSSPRSSSGRSRCSRRRSASASSSSSAVIVAIVGNAAEHGGAVVVAHRGKIALAAEIALASAAQVAVFLIPAVALLSWLIDPLSLSFRPVEIAALGGSVAFAALVLFGGQSSRARGYVLLGGYARRRGRVLPRRRALGARRCEQRFGMSSARACDVLVRHLEVRDGAHDGGMDRRREADAGIREPGQARRPARGRDRPTSIWTKFVSTCSRSTGMPASWRRSRERLARERDRRRAGRRGDRARTAPAAATIPACRIAPPKRCFSRHARSISSREPARSAPSGQPSPFERQSVTVSKRAAIAAGATPSATDALRSRAPSRCTASPSSRAVATTSSSSSSGQTRPPELLCVSLEREHRGALVGDLRARLGGGAHLLRRELPALARHAERHEAGVRRSAAVLVDHDVRVLLGDEDVTGPRLDLQRDLIRHRRGRQEDRLLLPEQVGDAGLELVHARVLALLLVADRRPPRSRDACPRVGCVAVSERRSITRGTLPSAAWISHSSSRRSPIAASPPTGHARSGSGRRAGCRRTRR